MKYIHYIIGIIILIIVFLIVTPIFKDIANRERCYNLYPSEFYSDNSCKDYWGGYDE